MLVDVHRFSFFFQNLNDFFFFNCTISRELHTSPSLHLFEVLQVYGKPLGLMCVTAFPKTLWFSCTHRTVWVIGAALRGVKKTQMLT